MKIVVKYGDKEGFMEFTEKMKADVLAAARDYIASETDAIFSREVENAVELGDWEGLYDRFYTSLAFGTAAAEIMISCITIVHGDVYIDVGIGSIVGYLPSLLLP